MPAADSVLWRTLDDDLDEREQRARDVVTYDAARRAFSARCPDCGERALELERSAVAWQWLVDHSCLEPVGR